eukprot:1876386-Rhodomonas_salina.1
MTTDRRLRLPGYRRLSHRVRPGGVKCSLALSVLVLVVVVGVQVPSSHAGFQRHSEMNQYPVRSLSRSPWHGRVHRNKGLGLGHRGTESQNWAPLSRKEWMALDVVRAVPTPKNLTAG